MKLDRYIATPHAPWRRRAVIVCGVIVAFIILLRVCLPSAFVSMFRPVLALSDSVTRAIGQVQDAVTDRAYLVRENTALKEALAERERELVYSRALHAERQEHEALIGRTEHHLGTVPAGVVYTATLAPHDTFMLDVGAEDGVRESMLVSTVERLVLGSVVSVGSVHSTVRSFCASGVSTEVLLLDAQVVPLRAMGMGGGTCVGEVPRDVPVAEGTAAILPGLETLVFGTVVDVFVEREDAYQQVYVQPAANPTSVRSALVWTTLAWRAEQ